MEHVAPAHYQSNVIEPYTPHLHNKARMSEGWKTTQQWKGKKEQETWKMSAKPRHAQLVQEAAIRRQSAPVMRKPLPQEPNEPVYPHYHQGSGYFQPPYTQPSFHSAEMTAQAPPYYGYPYSAVDPLPAVNYPPAVDYPPAVNYPPAVDYPYPTSIEHPPSAQTHSAPDHTVTLSDPPLETKKEPVKTEKMTKQITVQSINKEHRVWIDVIPSETGISLAEKIHIIATFRTRKIVSITTASGRKVPLDHRPVFGNWVDMDTFENGERWTVEWCENDRGVMERWISKVVQAGGGKRARDHIAKTSPSPSTCGK